MEYIIGMIIGWIGGLWFASAYIYMRLVNHGQIRIGKYTFNVSKTPIEKGSEG